MVVNEVFADIQPFSIKLSTNVEEFVFSRDWNHRQHYQAVFNSQFDLLPSHMPDNKPWAILADWRRWLAQTPAEERLCIRCVDRFVANGMTHYALVCDDHPLAKWQAERVKEANPSLSCKVFDDFDEAYRWLEESGFDLGLKPTPFKPKWLNPSMAFDQVLRDLDADASKFVTTNAFA